jgi:hypothetical protein
VPDKGAYMNVFNASDEPVTVALFGSETWTLHPVLASSTDPIVKTAKHDANGFYIPARTTAAFSRTEQRSCAPYPVDMYVRGSFNDWADPPKPEYKLEFLGGKDYAVSAPVTLPATGDPAFKIAAPLECDHGLRRCRARNGVGRCAHLRKVQFGSTLRRSR